VSKKLKSTAVGGKCTVSPSVTDTPENPPYQTIRKDDHELLRFFALLVVEIG
jgi:hypothetical protein